MQVIIDTSNQFKLNWTVKGFERIIQNVFNLLNIWRYEVTYDRTLGLDTSLIDLPVDLASAKYIAEVYRIVPLYEPRANVIEVKYLGVDTDGQMQFRVVIEV